MKRFHKQTDTAEVEGGFDVRLDGKPIRTPGGVPLVVPTLELARAIAGEWDDLPIGKEINPANMPTMRLAATGVERVPQRRDQVTEDTAGYAASDLLCYRAEAPPSLVERQARAWQPLLDWLARRHDATLTVATGIVFASQPPEALAAVRAAVDAHGDLALAGLTNLTQWMGSVVLALAVSDGRLDAGAAFEAAELDALYQIEKWGADAEQTRRLDRLRRDIEAAGRFMTLLGGHRLRG